MGMALTWPYLSLLNSFAATKAGFCLFQKKSAKAQKEGGSTHVEGAPNRSRLYAVAARLNANICGDDFAAVWPPYCSRQYRDELAKLGIPTDASGDKARSSKYTLEMCQEYFVSKRHGKYYRLIPTKTEKLKLFFPSEVSSTNMSCPSTRHLAKAIGSSKGPTNTLEKIKLPSTERLSLHAARERVLILNNYTGRFKQLLEKYLLPKHQAPIGIGRHAPYPFGLGLHPIYISRVTAARINKALLLGPGVYRSLERAYAPTTGPLWGVKRTPETVELEFTNHPVLPVLTKSQAQKALSCKSFDLPGAALPLKEARDLLQQANNLACTKTLDVRRNYQKIRRPNGLKLLASLNPSSKSQQVPMFLRFADLVKDRTQQQLFFCEQNEVVTAHDPFGETFEKELSSLISDSEEGVTLSSIFAQLRVLVPKATFENLKLATLRKILIEGRY
jgi:hypothetical protein